MCVLLLSVGVPSVLLDVLCYVSLVLFLFDILLVSSLYHHSREIRLLVFAVPSFLVSYLCSVVHTVWSWSLPLYLLYSGMCTYSVC